MNPTNKLIALERRLEGMQVQVSIEIIGTDFSTLAFAGEVVKVLKVTAYELREGMHVLSLSLARLDSPNVEAEDYRDMNLDAFITYCDNQYKLI